MATVARVNGLSTAESGRFMANPLASDLEFLTARARAVGTTRANRALAPLNLSVRSYAALALACGGEMPTQREIAEFLVLDASQVVTLIDQLETAGLIERSPDKSDRRLNVILPTSKGLEVYEQARSAVSDAEDNSLRSLSLEDRDTLRDLLSRIAFEQ